MEPEFWSCPWGAHSFPRETGQSTRANQAGSYLSTAEYKHTIHIKWGVGSGKGEGPFLTEVPLELIRRRGWA